MSFEKTCYQQLDEPVLVWLGLEFHEVVISIAGGAGIAIAGWFLLGLGFPGIVAGFATGAALLGLFRALRRGGPGYIFTRLYRLGLVEWLPCGIRPRHLLPLGGREGRFRFSPVAELEDDHAYIRKRYFGR